MREREIKRERVKNASIKAYMRAYIHCKTHCHLKMSNYILTCVICWETPAWIRVQVRYGNTAIFEKVEHGTTWICILINYIHVCVCIIQ